MLLTIPQLLSTTQLKQVQDLLDKADFIDGKLSAGKVAKKIKNNQEINTNDKELLNQLNNIVMGTLIAHPEYKSAVLAHRIAVPFYARYQKGMQYGYHIDDPVMGPNGGRYRSDVSITIFLNEPEDYEGGELSISTTFGVNKVKLPAGAAVMYPSSSLHQVAEITSGERLVAVTWAQSMIREPAKRELLYDLDKVREKLFLEQPNAIDTAKLDNVYANLVRMWAEV